MVHIHQPDRFSLFHIIREKAISPCCYHPGRKKKRGGGWWPSRINCSSPGRWIHRDKLIDYILKDVQSSSFLPLKSGRRESVSRLPKKKKESEHGSPFPPVLFILLRYRRRLKHRWMVLPFIYIFYFLTGWKIPSCGNHRFVFRARKLKDWRSNYL